MGVSPLLAAMGNYGGPTQTLALLPGSPAIDAGTASISGVTVPATDQRGLGRVGNVDIGAFESQGFTLAVASGSTPQSAYVNSAFANPLVVTVTANNGIEPVDGGFVTFLAPGSGPTATLSATTATIAAGAASVTATANGTAGGPYTVSASTAGAAAPASFVLTNQFPLSQTISFGPLANQTYGVVPITLTATASSNLPVSYTVISGRATVSGDILTVTGVGLVDVEADQGGNATYAAAPSVDESFTVNPAQLTITANPATKVYGAADPTLTYQVSGFQFSDDEATVLSGALSRAIGEHVGGYAISQGSLAANSDYTIAFTGNSLTITPATLTVTADAQTKVYGQSDPTLTYQVSGFQFTDDEATVLSGALSRAIGEHVGGYAISQGSLAANSDYTIAFTGNSLTITPATLSVAANAQTNVYGAADPALTYVASGFQFSDTEATVLSGALARAAGEHVGSYAIGQGTLAADSDYTISFTGSTLTITPATLTVTADAQTKVYGQADPALTYAATGFQFSDTAGSVLTGGLTRASGEGAGGYAITQGTLAADSDYTISFTGSTFTITPATLTVTADAQTKVYGQADPALTYAATGFQFSDTAGSVLTGGLTRASGEGAGGYAITQGTLAADSDCTISFTGSTLTITPAPLSVIVDAKTRVYGQANPTLTGTVSGILNGDAVTVNYTTTATPASGVVARGYPITVGSLSGPKAVDYSVTVPGASVTPAVLTITKAHLTVTADAKNMLYGGSVPALTATISGFVKGDTLAVVSGSSSLSTTATSSSPVGTYTITVTTGSLSAVNYDFPNLVHGNLTVNKAHLTVTADAKSKVYGAAVPALTATISGFVNGDTTAVVSGMPALTTTATASSLPGSYPITVAAGTLSASNYDFPNLVKGKLTVTGTLFASVAIVPSVASPIYGKALTFTAKVSPPSSGEPTPGGTVQFQVDGANLGQAVTLVKGAATSIATSTLGAGKHTVTAVYSGDNTYAANSGNRRVTLAKAHLTVSADAKSKVYGAVVPALTYTITGFVNGDTANVVSGAEADHQGDHEERVGTYFITIAVGTLSASNYDFSNLNLVKGKLTVTRHLTVTAVNKTKKQGVPTQP